MERTTEEIVNSLNGCAKSIGCEKCFANWGNPCCISELEKAAADRLVSQQKEIAELNDKLNKKMELNARMAHRLYEKDTRISELKKQMAETYTAEQFSKDIARYLDSKYIGYPEAILTPKLIEEWAASHPEKPKVTNGDKFREVFGHKNWVKCYAESIPNCPVDDCEECEYGINGEYKEPKNG